MTPTISRQILGPRVPTSLRAITSTARPINPRTSAATATAPAPGAVAAQKRGYAFGQKGSDMGESTLLQNPSSPRGLHQFILQKEAPTPCMRRVYTNTHPCHRKNPRHRQEALGQQIRRPLGRVQVRVRGPRHLEYGGRDADGACAVAGRHAEG